MKFWQRSAIVVLSTLSLIACSHKAPKNMADESRKFNAFMDQVFDQDLAMSPEGLTYFGKKDQYNKLDDHTEAFDQKMLQVTMKHLEDMKQFDRDALDPQTKLTYDLYLREGRQFQEDFKWRNYGYVINQQAGVHADLPVFMINMHRVDSEQDLKDYVSRLNEFKRVFAEVGDQLKASEKVGVIPPKFVFPYVYKASANVITGKPFDNSKKDSPLYADFKSKMKKLKLTPAQQKADLADAEKALKTSVKPAYDGLIAQLKDLETRATTDDGIWKVPHGDEYYNLRLKRVTTLPITADDVHNMGLKNVERLRGEMEAIKNKLGFKGDLQAFFAKIRKDPKQYFPNTDAGRKAYLKMANGFKDNIYKKVPEFFRTVPKTELQIKAVEKFREVSAGKAFYEGPSDDGTRPGVFYANLRNMKDQAKYEAEALFYHEGVPGHHFQIALAIEMKNLPKFRRYSGNTAFVEGWGLYAERLGKEMGGYKDDYSELGRLSMEMVRACRLVVDTGIHSKRWTRQQAIDYLNKNLPVNEGMVVEQVERYIIWPGQATGYMVGMLRIAELRDKAQKALGDKFDLRDFHAVVLESGALPLEFLEQRVDQYIAAKKG